MRQSSLLPVSKVLRLAGLAAHEDTHPLCLQPDSCRSDRGRAAAEAKLDNLFRENPGTSNDKLRSKYAFFSVFPDSTSMVGQFSMSNEPGFATPYIYNHLGALWKTQKRIRQLLEYAFTDTLSGIPGVEDGGGMSAFVVFSMMGFYPVVPGVPVYELGSPIFDKVTMELANGKQPVLNANGTSRDAKYIRSVKFNGHPSRSLWFRHADLANGLKIDLEMLETPKKSIGSAPDDLPPSSMSLDPATLD